MCHLCEAIDEKIARYRRLASQIVDKQTLESIDSLVVKLEAKKKALHPEQT